jgi:hypothetical protein
MVEYDPKIVRRELKNLEKIAKPILDLRKYCWEGDLTNFGIEFVKLCQKFNIKDELIAKILNITINDLEQQMRE